MRLLLLLLLALPWACADPREELEQLPHEVAEHLRAGEIADALECLHQDFEGHGLDRAALQRVLLYQRGFEPVAPYVAEVFLDPSEDGEEERRLIVVGLLPKGDPQRTSSASLGPFRLTALARLVDGEWKILRATLER